MAGRGCKKQSKKNEINKKWLLGVYTRRSFDDGEVEESYTITNQKLLIEDFLENNSIIVKPIVIIFKHIEIISSISFPPNTTLYHIFILMFRNEHLFFAKMKGAFIWSIL